MADRTVAFVGLGTMGRPMALNVLKGGFALRAFDIVPSAIDALASAGATPAGSPADAARGADLVITMLPNSAHVDEAVFAAGGIAEGMAAGALYIDMSTIAPAMTDALARRLAERGLRMMDAPVGRQQQHAVEGKLLIMVGGERADLARARPVLERMADTIIHCGPVGAGSRMKIVNNFMSITLNATTAEALTLAEASGLDVELARKVMLGTVAGTGHMGTTYPAKVLKGDLTPGFMVDLALKDLRLALDLGQSLGLPLSTGETAERAYRSASEAGHGRHDWTALYAHARERLAAGRPVPGMVEQAVTYEPVSPFARGE
jgi:4-hydroxybutyrate dehydrogenase/sulfolactaldehyde 3-reductase